MKTRIFIIFGYVFMIVLAIHYAFITRCEQRIDINRAGELILITSIRVRGQIVTEAIDPIGQDVKQLKVNRLAWGDSILTRLKTQQRENF